MNLIEKLNKIVDSCKVRPQLRGALKCVENAFSNQKKISKYEYKALVQKIQDKSVEFSNDRELS